MTPAMCTVKNITENLAVLLRKLGSSILKDSLTAIRNHYVPLIIPNNLMNDYVHKYEEPYLQKQYYLKPQPTELKLSAFKGH